MGLSRGTGAPLSFFCAKCRLQRTEHLHVLDRDIPRRWVLTGRRRQREKKARGNLMPRMLPYRLEYRCLECGHVGWSAHHQVEQYAQRAERSGET